MKLFQFSVSQLSGRQAPGALAVPPEFQVCGFLLNPADHYFILQRLASSMQIQLVSGM